MKLSGPQNRVRIPASSSDREPLHRDLEERRQPVPVGRQHREGAVLRRAVQGPGLGDGFEHPDQQAAALLAVVAVRLALLDHRHRLGRHAGDRLGEQVVVLGGLQRHGDAGLGRELATPQPRSEHDLLALEVTTLGADADDAATVEDEVGDLGVLEDLHAALPGALGHRHRDVDRVGPALVGGPEAVDDVVGADQRHQVLHLLRRQHVLGHPDRAHVRRLAAEALVGARRRRQLEVAALPEARGQSGLLLQPGVELGGVARHPQGVLGRAARDHLTGRVPGGARGELFALEQDDVGRPEEGQVVGDRRTDDAATDDDVLRAGGQVAGGGGGGSARAAAGLMAVKSSDMEAPSHGLNGCSIRSWLTGPGHRGQPRGG